MKKQRHRHAHFIEAFFYGEMPNVREFFSDAYILRFIHEYYYVYEEEYKHCHNKRIASSRFMYHFIDSHEHIRRCSICGKLTKSGYVLYGSFYACSEECMHNVYINGNEADSERDAERMYLCDHYCLDYNDYRDRLNAMHLSQCEAYLASLPESDSDHTDTYWTEF